MSRDRRQVITPPAGVRAQTEIPQRWDEELTPLPASTRETINTIARRVKDTSAETIDTITSVRQELRIDVAAVDGKVDDLGQSLASLHGQLGEMRGQLAIVLRDREQDRQELSTIRVDSVRAELDMRKAKELSAIEELKKKNEHRRNIALRILAGIGAIWATITTILLASK